ncbi:MAG: phosphatase PAP2 family protein [Ilumatobacteraceae bacterium]
MTHEPLVDDRSSKNHTSRLRDTWPIHKREVLQLVGAYVLITGVFVGLGALITGPLDGTSIVNNDQRLARSFVDHRTPSWNDASVIGSALAETSVKVLVTAIIAIALLITLKRWREPLVIAVALIMEASAFITVTFVVGRNRPDVPRLDTSPVGSSFPSGHVAAAVAYTAIAVVVFWLTRNLIARVAVTILCVAIPVIVALSRMYRGMHYLTDVTCGALLGLCAVVVTALILRPQQQPQPQPQQSGVADDVRAD